MRFFIKMIVLVFILVKSTFGDSPLTSTFFYNAYIDVPIVARGEKASVMDREFADYLHSPENSIDKKAALINALGWSGDAEKDNAGKYSREIFGKEINGLNLSSLSPDDAFVIGYLLALDKYHSPVEALPFLKSAREEYDESFTVAMILALVRAQLIMEKDFCKVWKYSERVFKDDDLDIDMRKKGRENIYDYMVLYKDECK